MGAPKWRSYDIINNDSPHADAFRAGARRNGGASERCPLCDGRRLHREPTFIHCREHNSWMCGESFLIGCHNCKVRYGVVVSKCELAEPVAVSAEPGGT